MREGTAARRACEGGTRALGLLAALLAGLQLTAIPALAAAQDSPRSAISEADKKKFLQHYDKGNRYYQVGKYPEAIAEFEAGYLINPDPVMIFNIAQSYRMNNQPEEAARFYRNYLRSAPEAANRSAVEKQIADMDRRAAEKRAAPATAMPPPVTTPPPGGTSPAVTPPAAGAPPAAGGPPPPTGTAPYPPVVPGPVSSDPMAGVSTTATAPQADRPSRVLPMVLMVSGGVLVATSLVFGAVAGGKAKEVEDLSNNGSRAFDDMAKDLETAGKRASAVAVASGLAGLAAGGLGLYFWLSSSPDEAAPAGQASPAATSRIFPLAAPGLLGAGAQVSF